MDDFISVSEAARRKGVTRQAIYQAINTGRLTPKLMIGKIAVSVSEVEAYMPLSVKERKGRTLKTWKHHGSSRRVCVND